MDIGSLISYTKVKEYRNKLCEISDKIIPVWHKNLGIQEFKNMCNEYEYVSIGGIVSREIKRNELAPFVKYAHNNNCRIHGLGLTATKELNTIPFDSVDSSSWMQSRFGRIYLFKNNKVESKRINSKYVSDNYKNIDFLSYINSIKFQQYYYNKWKYYHND